jgi:hypothetical protein
MSVRSRRGPWGCETSKLPHFSDNLLTDGGDINAMSVRSRGGPWGCETSRLPHCLDYLLTDGGEMVSLTRRPTALYPKEVPGIHFG